MSKIRIVHVSDIHFGQEKDGSLPEHDDVRQALIRDCKIMEAKIGSANGIVVTGDIAFSGKKKEYETAAKWLDELVATVKCSEIAVHTIPGNHDVDVKAIDYTAELFHEKLRGAAVKDVDGILEKIVPAESATSPLLTKLSAYNEFASRYDSDFESAAKPVSTKELVFPSGHRLRFLGFASVQVSDLDDQPVQMVLGNRQYIFSPHDNVEYVIMSHHPLHWFKDKARARPRLVSRARMMLFGHEHQASIQKVTENGNEYVVIDAGSTNPPLGEGEDRQPHAYNWIEFSVVEAGAQHSLEVTVHPRVWMPDKAEFDAARSKINGEESCTFSLRCPNYKKIDAPKHKQAEVVTEIPIGVREGDAVPRPDDEKFAKLLYYFWRYLDWRQRYEVLARVGVLPKGLEKPMPQVLERTALENARAQQQLSPIWDEVMKVVPEVNREANPF